MRKIVPAVLALAVVGLGGCSGDELTRTFGLTRDAPDEFQVTTRAPLSMPPNYSLRPPEPGERRPQEMTQRQQAEAALVPDTVNLAGSRQPQSAGEQSLVASAGPPAPQNIRAEVNREGAFDTGNRTFVDRLMFWKPTPPAGTAVDPVREAQRLRQNSALGQSPEVGDTPIIQRRRAGSFLGLF